MESERSTPSQSTELDARTTPRVWPISGGTLFRHQITVTLASWYRLTSWLCRRRLVDTLVAEQCPGDAGSLIGHGDQHDVCRSPFQEPAGPAGMPARLGAAPAQHASRAMHEQTPDGAVPRFDMRPSLSLPPLECCRGTRPSQAESCRPDRNCAPSPIVATSAVAVMTPTPGIVARRRLASLDRCHAKSVASSCLIWSCPVLVERRLLYFGHDGLECDRRFIVEGGMASHRIVEAVDVTANGGSGNWPARRVLI